MPKRGGSPTAGLAPSGPAIAIELIPLAELCDRLEARQRLFLQHGLASLERLIRSAAARGGVNHPQFVKLQNAFAGFRKKFTAHLREESETVFPLIRQMESRTVKNPRVRRSLQTHAVRLKQQHFEADEAIAGLCALTGGGYSPELCESLASFEHSLHEQIYEENRVLFPRALAVSRA